MTLPVHLVPALDAAVGATVTVTGAEAHHAVTVRRLRVGESVVLTDGAGRSAVGEVAATSKGSFDGRGVGGQRPAGAGPRGRGRPGAAEGRPRRARRRGADRGGGRGRRAVGGRPLCRGLEGRARGAVGRQVALDGPGGGQAGAAYLVPDGVGPGDHAPTSRPWSPAPTWRWSSTRRPRPRWPPSTCPPRGGWWSWSAPRAASPTTRWPPSTAAGAVPVRLGPEVLRTSTAGVAAVAALLSRTPRWS